ncbi:MAG: FHA domain-containing protein [Lachnospiraceae bacterium]|nr:FHA domain-containing protein [Lachnospiraceae bacterium]
MKKKLFEKRRILWLLFTLLFLWTVEDVTTLRTEAAGPEAVSVLRGSERSSRRDRDDEDDEDDEDKDEDEDEDEDDDDDDGKSSRRRRGRDEDEDESGFPWVPVLIAVFSVLAVILIVLIIILLTKNGKNSRRYDDRDMRDAYREPDPYRTEDPYSQPASFDTEDTYPQNNDGETRAPYVQAAGYQGGEAYGQPAPYQNPDPYPQPQPQVPGTGAPYQQPMGYAAPPANGRNSDTVVLGAAHQPAAEGEETLTMNVKRGPFVVISDPFNPQRTFRAEIRHHVVIGRKAPAEIIIDYDTGVSGSHCEIVNDGGTFYLKDLNSVNGTMYNGIPIHEPVPIQGGGKLRIGRYEYDVRFEEGT